MRAIVVRGGWEGHSPFEATDRFIPFLREHGYEVHASDSLDVYHDADRMAAADLIVQCWTMGEITREQRVGLDAAVRAGTGLAGWHGGIADAFPADMEYKFMTGGQFIAHPDGFVEYAIEVVSDHPIVAGIERFTLDTEQYYVHADPSNEVLATTTFRDHDAYPWIKGVTMPAVWTRHWGEGGCSSARRGTGSRIWTCRRCARSSGVACCGRVGSARLGRLALGPKECQAGTAP